MRHPDRCLLVYPRDVWETKLAEILKFPAPDRDLQRMFLGGASDVEMDGAGRVLITPELREFAHFERDAILLGLGHHFELWDRARYQEREAKACAAVNERGMPASLGNFTF